jgi:hypothetical protein
MFCETIPKNVCSVIYFVIFVQYFSKKCELPRYILYKKF